MGNTPLPEYINLNAPAPSYDISNIYVNDQKTYVRSVNYSVHKREMSYKPSKYMISPDSLYVTSFLNNQFSTIYNPFLNVVHSNMFDTFSESIMHHSFSLSNGFQEKLYFNEAGVGYKHDKTYELHTQSYPILAYCCMQLINDILSKSDQLQYNSIFSHNALIDVNHFLEEPLQTLMPQHHMNAFDDRLKTCSLKHFLSFSSGLPDIIGGTRMLSRGFIFAMEIQWSDKVYQNVELNDYIHINGIQFKVINIASTQTFHLEPIITSENDISKLKESSLVGSKVTLTNPFRPMASKYKVKETSSMTYIQQYDRDGNIIDVSQTSTPFESTFDMYAHATPFIEASFNGIVDHCTLITKTTTGIPYGKRAYDCLYDPSKNNINSITENGSLAHIPSFKNNMLNPEPWEESLENVVSKLNECSLAYDPGTEWEISSSHYMYLIHIMNIILNSIPMVENDVSYSSFTDYCNHIMKNKLFMKSARVINEYQVMAKPVDVSKFYAKLTCDYDTSQLLPITLRKHIMEPPGGIFNESWDIDKFYKGWYIHCADFTRDSYPGFGGLTHMMNNSVIYGLNNSFNSIHSGIIDSGLGLCLQSEKENTSKTSLHDNVLEMFDLYYNR